MCAVLHVPGFAGAGDGSGVGWLEGEIMVLRSRDLSSSSGISSSPLSVAAGRSEGVVVLGVVTWVCCSVAVLTGGVGRDVTCVCMISSASGTEGGEVFYRLMDWLGSRDPLTPYDTHVAHRLGLDD
jgi:hypothetical protein